MLHQQQEGSSEKEKAKRLFAQGQQALSDADDELAESYIKEAHALVLNDLEIHQTLAQLRHVMYCKERKALRTDSSLRTYFPLRIDNLVFSDEGMATFSYLGALSVLGAEYVNLATIKRVAGTGIGALPAFLMGLGYSLDECQAFCTSFDLLPFLEGKEKVLSSRSHHPQSFSGRLFSASRASSASVAKSELGSHFLQSCLQLIDQNSTGLCQGDYLREAWAERLIQAKTGIPYATFAELVQIRKENQEACDGLKDIYLTGFNLQTQQVQVFSYETTPDVIVSDALRIALTFPLFFTPHAIYTKQQGIRVIDSHQQQFVYGSFKEPYPLALFDQAHYLGLKELKGQIVNPYTLGLSVKRNAEQKKQSQPKAESMAEVLWQSLGSTQQSKGAKARQKEERGRSMTISIEEGYEQSLPLSREAIEAFMSSGEQAVRRYVQGKLSHPTQKSLAEAIASNDSKAVQQLLSQGEEANRLNGEGEYVLDLAFAKNNKVMIVTLVIGGAYATHHAEAIYEILLKGLENKFINRVLLQKSLAQFAFYHEIDKEERNKYSISLSK